jgi:hypothetical protein
MLAHSVAWRRVLPAAAVAVGLLAGLARADETEDEWFEEVAKGGLVVKTTRSHRDKPQFRRLDIQAYTDDPEPGAEPTGRLRVSPFSLRVDKRYFPAEASYPGLRAGDVLPLLGRLFRVAGVAPEAGPNRPGTIAVRPLALADVPAGLSFRKDSLALPGPAAALKPGTLTIGTHALLVWEIGPVKDRGVVAVLTGGLEPQYPRVALRVGDYLRLGGVGHEVLAIVPRDPKTRAVGWVELAGEPVPIGGLMRKGATVLDLQPE